MTGQDDTERTMKTVKMAREFGAIMESRKWASLIPFIPYKQGWLVRPMPQVGTAVTRMHVRTEAMHKDDRVSIYLDCYGHLGAEDEPYWEIYDGDDVSRCNMNEVDELVDLIGLAIETMIKYRAQP